MRWIRPTSAKPLERLQHNHPRNHPVDPRRRCRAGSGAHSEILMAYSLHTYEREQDEGYSRREELERLYESQNIETDLRLKILDSVLSSPLTGHKADPYEFLVWCREHFDSVAPLLLLGFAKAYPYAKPAGWDEGTAISLRASAWMALDCWINARLPAAREAWFREAEESGYGK